MMRDTLRTLFIENPMFDEGARAMRRFFRTGDAPRVVNFVATVLIGLFYLWLLAMIIRFHEDMTLFLLMVEVFIVTTVTVASIYGAVAGERERATWEALIITRITPGQIIAGKVVWRLLLAVIVIVLLAIPTAISASYPHSWNASTVLWTPWKLLLAHGIIFAWAVLLCAYGLWISSRSRRSVTAAAVLAGSLLAALLFVPMLLEMFGMHSMYERPTSGLDFVGWGWTHMSPFVAVPTIERNNILDSVEIAAFPLTRNWNLLLPWLYLLIAAVFFYTTNDTLHRLEEPNRRSEK